MDDLNILSANCQGLGEHLKRKDTFSYLRAKHYNIYCLQDTHFTAEKENIIRNEWGYECYFNSFKSNARGVAVLCNNNFEFKVKGTKTDMTGNFLAIDLELKDTKLTLITVYGPNSDDPNFFNLLSDTIDSFGNSKIIICGDFNLVINPRIDYDESYKSINNPKARDKILEVIENYNLIDIYREQHPDSKRYTWRKPNPLKQSRLDFFLISENLVSSVTNSSIETGYRSDHSFPKISVQFHEFKRGKGLWKFNNSLLYDSEYKKVVNDVILDTKKQYCLPIYNLENIDNIPDLEMQFTIDDQLFLETLLMNIRGKTISHAAYKKKLQNQKEIDLQKSIEELESQNILNLIDIEQKKKELEEIRLKKIKGSIIRSRAKWEEEGEKPTNYFFNLENRNFTSKIIPKLQIENGNIITKQEEILHEIKCFYENLYKSDSNLYDVNLEDFLEFENIPKLNISDAEKLEGFITLDEASKILRNMKNNKSPGSDGYTVEFFKYFWKHLGQFIIRSLNYGYIRGELSVTQRHGVITCIPKKDKPRQFIKNWRPITLLNIVYKIGSGVIANRLKSVLDKIIDRDQSGFISGRYMGENTRLLYDVMQYTEDNDIPGMVLMIDFEKAFDSVSWEFIEKVLHFFGFGNSIRNWVKLFNNNVGASVNQGGNFSPFFRIQRGCRQGDPVSPYIFILCAEVLAIRFRNNKSIKGIEIDNTDILLSQYADDTYLTLDGTEKSLKESINELNSFASISGLKINIDKTEIVWIGSKKYSQDKFLPELNLKWGKEKFTLLGIDFCVDLHEMIKLNFDKKIVKLKNTVKAWNRRNLTPIGKVHLIKSLMISLFNHLFISLPNPGDKVMQKINSILFEFLWHSKIDKVKRDVITQDYAQGGLKMINIKNFVDSLKLGWIKRLYRSCGKWKTLLGKSVDLNKLLNVGGNYLDKCQGNISNTFWKDVLNAWIRLDSSDNMKVVKGRSLLLTPVWHNKNIIIGGRTVFYSQWYEKGIYVIGDFFKDISTITLLSFNEFVQKYSINTDILKYNGIITAVRKCLQTFNDREYNLIRPILPNNIAIFFNNNKGSKAFYDLLNARINVTSKGKEKWTDIFELDENDWFNIYTLPFKISKNSRLQWLQFRISQHILTTNSFLFKVKLLDNPFCNLCNSERESIIHLFWECDQVQNLLERFDMLLDALFIPFRLNKKTMFFGNLNDFNSPASKIDNQIILLIKKYIYGCRCQHKSLNINSLLYCIYDHYKVQKYIVNNKGEKEKTKFLAEWKKWNKLIQILD